MTTPEPPVGGSAGPGVPHPPEEGVIRVFPGPPPASGAAQPPQPTPRPATPPPPGPPSASDEAKNAAGDVKDQAASSAGDVKDTAASQAGAVKDTAQQQAAQVKDTAADAASDVAATAREQAQNVVGEASQQARQLADSLVTQLNEQASTQQQRAAGGVRSLAEGVSDMAEGRGAPESPVGDLTRQAADRLQTAASYLERKQPNDLLNDVRSFASRRPGAFLLGAAVAGFAVGRIVKGSSSASSSPGTAGGSNPSGSLPTAPAAQPAPTPAPPPTPAPAPASPPPVLVFDDIEPDEPGFGTPTPPPGYESRIPVAPIIEEPYQPRDGLYGDIDPTRDANRETGRTTPPVTHGDPFGEDMNRDLPGGGRGV
ncbi:MAG: hypothetical protein QOC98_1632 [Frankiaceae bacterium]|nr:hypothetical protein [Frankiaceae bacterium]